MPESSIFKSLEEILLESKKITQQQFDAIRIQAVNLGITTKEIIRDGNFVTPEEYALAYSKAYSVDYITLKGKKIDPDLFDLVPVDFAKKYEQSEAREFYFFAK